MKKLVTLLSAVVLLVGGSALRARAQNPALEDLGINLNGTFDDLNSDGGLGIDPGVAGATLDLSGLALDPSNSFLSGLGSVSLVFDPGGSGGSYFFDAFVQEAAGTPAFNEYTDKGGSLAVGESWENGYIPVCSLSQSMCESTDGVSTGDPDGTMSSVYTDVYNGGASANGILANSNSLPSASSNYLEGCLTEPGCNGYGIVALGQTFVLTSGEEEVLTLTGSLTAPNSGFYVTEVNPIDSGNIGCEANNQSNTSGCLTTVYYSLSASEQPSGSQPPPPPGNTPEPSSWILVASGLGMGLKRLRGRFSFKMVSKAFAAVLALTALMAAPMAKAQTVLTVPWVPGTAAPHTAAAGTPIILGAVFIPGSGESTTASNYTFQWSYGDGSPAGTLTTATYLNDLESSHTYSGTIAQTFTATVTVTDKTTSNQYQATYPVIFEDVNVLQTRVNIAIDWGLWALHKSEYHPTATSGNWDGGCGDGLSTYTCGTNYPSITATNVQAFEVNGHLANGPASDPYTQDVAQGLDDLFWRLAINKTLSTTAKNYYADPAVATWDCVNNTADHKAVQPADTSGTCPAGTTKTQYNASATSCPGAATGGAQPHCTYFFNGNGDGNGVWLSTSYGAGDDAGYEQGMIIDAIVASGTPNALAPPASPGTDLQGHTVPAGIAGNSYYNIVGDFANYINYCQYGFDYDAGGGINGYTRGAGYSTQGGGWLYGCQGGDDNSTSQWESIGLISALRAPGFGFAVPAIVKDELGVWVTNSEDVSGNVSAGVNSWQNAGDTYGGYGYRGSMSQSPEWGPWAVTPSGMVQMSLAGVGRTTNTAFGDASNSTDQRFNNVETLYADNFCNTNTSAVYSPKEYTYGLFSFTKSMLLHNPGGVLSPIQYMRTETPGVFSPTSSPIPNTIDWYAAVANTHYGGGDACDGVAQTLVGRQYQTGNVSGYPAGTWYGDNYDGPQNTYETAWSLIMLQRTVFVQCVNNLTGSGVKGGGLTKPMANLSWSGIPNVSGYNVYVSTANGGPYTQVTYSGGTTTQTSFSDRAGLTNGVTYYFVIDPINSAGATVCQSNQATITIP